LLDALKGDESTEESLSLFVSAFRSLLASCLSADLLRSLALFITYAIHDAKPLRLQRKKSIRFDARVRRLAVATERTQGCLSKAKVGVEILRMYCTFLCAPDEVLTIKKFARAVTNKVGYKSPRVSLLRLR
jgi:beige protein homolog 1